MADRSDSSQLTVGTVVGNESAGNNGRVNFPNGIILADTPEGYYLGTTFTFPPSPFGPTPTIESRKIDMGGAQIDIQANTTIGHMDVDDSMFASGTITFTDRSIGDGNTLSNLETSTTRSRVLAYTYIFADPPFQA